MSNKIFKVIWINHDGTQLTEFCTNQDTLDTFLSICEDRGERVVFIALLNN